MQNRIASRTRKFTVELCIVLIAFVAIGLIIRGPFNLLKTFFGWLVRTVDQPLIVLSIAVPMTILSMLAVLLLIIKLMDMVSETRASRQKKHDRSADL